MTDTPKLAVGAGEQRAMMEDRIKILEKTLEEAVGYVIGCIGSSYCDTDKEDWETLHNFEDILGVERTKKSSFY